MTAFNRLVATGAIGLFAAGAAWGQAFSTKTVTMVVPFTAGGPTDTVARSLAVGMTKALGQSVVVEAPKAAIDKLVAALQAGTLEADFQRRMTELGATVYPVDQVTPAALGDS